jgi:hypothetical protein
MKKIPVGATIAHAYRFTFEDFPRILGVMWPSMLLMWVPYIILRPQMMALSAQMASQNISGLGELWPAFVFLYPMMLILIAVQVIGIAQLALDRHKGPSWFYFSLGMPVWRWIGSLLLMIAVMIVGWLVVVLADVAVGALLRAFIGSAGNGTLTAILGLLIVVFILATLCALFYCWIRLSFLFTPVIAADEEGFALGRSWTLGKGNFWRMFAILVVIFGPFLVLEFIFIFEFALRGLPALPAHASPAQAAAYQAAVNAHTVNMMNTINHYWYIAYPVGTAFMVVFYGLAVGAQCFAYRALTEDEASAAVAFD